ncbi:MAG TPA: MBL fold metallo-hydrolase [Acidimicrobiales bacterium]|jgi:glyoxylase-like metal-dependent hydrolase (beta-lactamase superfamily II)|nr:MBL fold metallo-hydrolase [Acidimicrobiales bacterium]
MRDRLYFRQLLSGRDLAPGDRLASQMVNFVYLIGDRDTGDAVVVDPAYDVDTIIDTLAADEMTLRGVLATHYHADHVGGSMMGFSIRGVADLLERVSVPVHIQADEADYVTKTTGLTASDLVNHRSGDTLTVGGLEIELIHTPGHTPGSQCFLVADRLVSGDTLFLEGCGRTDLPGSDPKAMYESLTQRLAKVPDTAVLYPGHWYAPAPHGSLGETRRDNYVFRPQSEEQWLMMFGG